MPGSWSVRPLAASQTPTPFVVGTWAADFDADLAAAAVEGKAIEPMTSIGWLFWHVGSQPGRTAQLDFLGGAYSAHSGWTSPYIAAHPDLHDCRGGCRGDESGLAGARHGTTVGKRRTT